MRNDKPRNLIVDLTFEFSVAIIEYCEALYNMKRYKMADQVFRSGTGIGANVKEAQNAESRFDFTHKMKIAAKECDETTYWLDLCEHSKVFPSTLELKQQLHSVSRVLDKIISTSKNTESNKASSNLQIFKSSNQEEE